MKLADEPRDEVEPTEDHEAARYARHWSDDPKHYKDDER